MKQIHFFYFFKRTEDALIPMVTQVIVEHDASLEDEAAACRRAEKAQQLAADDNAQPFEQMRPLCVIDVPEVHLICQRGDVQTVYGRTSVAHPSVTVYDLDSCDNEQEAELSIRKLLESQGFRPIPFHQGDTAATSTPQ